MILKWERSHGYLRSLSLNQPGGMRAMSANERMEPQVHMKGPQVFDEKVT